MPSTLEPDAFRALEASLGSCERPARYIDHERGARRDESAAYRAVLVYPDTYEIGMANQALGILYDALLSIEGVAAERAFVPWKDLAAAMREGGLPLTSLETGTPLASCDMVGITLPYELTFPNVLETLDLAGVPLRSADRTTAHPLVIGGGPAAFDPEPMAPFFDAILIGEGERAIREIVGVHREAKAAGWQRGALLEALAERVPGLYVPGLYEGSPAGALATTPRAPERVRRRVVEDFAASHPPECPIVPYMDVVHDRAAIEITRGCTRGCRFCQAGIVYRPVRERSADSIVRDVVATLACTGYDEVSLTSLSSADHSQLEEVLRRLTARLRDRGISLSLPSLRVDAFSVDMARLVSSGKKSGLTFAPEAGTQRLRDVINKGVTEADLLGTVERAFSAGFHRIKLYFMIGLPTETDEDVAEIGALVGRVLHGAREATESASRGSVRVSVSVTTFVPKAHTPFQWEPLIDRGTIARRQDVLRRSMPRRAVELSYHDVEISLLEGALARGDRRVADVIEHAWRHGAAFSAWSDEFDISVWREAFEACGLPAPCGGSPAGPGEPLAWDHIDTGVTRQFLLAERDRALAGAATPDCSFGECGACGVCTGDVRIDLAEPRR